MLVTVLAAAGQGMCQQAMTQSSPELLWTARMCLGLAQQLADMALLPRSLHGLTEQLSASTFRSMVAACSLTCVISTDTCCTGVARVMPLHLMLHW